MTDLTGADIERMVEHVELDSVRPGMTVTLNGREIGRVEDLILQPDNLHVLRLITRRASTGQRIAIPIEWVRGIQDGRVVLLVGTHELGLLPDYHPPISAGAASLGVQAARGRRGRDQGCLLMPFLRRAETSRMRPEPDWPGTNAGDPSPTGASR